MRVLGIDPGLTRCGIGIISADDPKKLTFEHVEVLTTSPKDDLSLRLGKLGASLQKILSSAKIDEVAIERVFAGENLPSVMGVAQISGVVMYLAASNAIPVTMYTPKEVKSKVTGYGSADKTQVTNMVTKILKLGQPPKPADAADALALAITHAWSRNTRTTTRGATGAAGIARAGRLTPAQEAWLAAERKSR